MQCYSFFTLFVTTLLLSSCGGTYFLSTIYHLVEKTCKRPFFSQPFKTNILCAVHCFKAPSCQAFGTTNNTCSFYSSVDSEIKEENMHCYTEAVTVSAAEATAVKPTTETSTVNATTKAVAVPSTTTGKMTAETTKTTTETTTEPTEVTTTTETLTTEPTEVTTTTETLTTSPSTSTTEYSTSSFTTSTVDPTEISFCFATFDSSSSTFTCCAGSIFYGLGFCSTEERVCEGICVSFPSPDDVSTKATKSTDECLIAFTILKANSNSYEKSCVTLNRWITLDDKSAISQTSCPSMNITGSQLANPDKWFLCDTSEAYAMYKINSMFSSSNLVSVQCRRLLFTG